MKALKIHSEIRSLLQKALQEDLGPGDVTTRLFIPKKQRGEARVVVKEAGIFSGGAIAREVFRTRDPRLAVRIHAREGSKLRKGQIVMSLKGRVQPILEAERVALNFLGHLSGIATLTRAFVDRIKRTPAKIYDTRKTTPLLRELEKYAVRCGRGENHRFGLWDEILVKDNHWAVMPSFQFARLAMAKKHHNLPLEIEVRHLKELIPLLELPFTPDRVLLDNFSVRELKRSVLFVHSFYQVLKSKYGISRKRPLLEASGGVRLENVRKMAQTGVDRISIGRLTHSAPALDFSLSLTKVHRDSR